MASSRDLDLGTHPDGATLRVRAAPGASREGIRGVHAGAVKIAVSSPAEKGKANDRIRELLAAALGLASRRLVLLSGAAARDKTFCVCGLDQDELRSQLDRILSG